MLFGGLAWAMPAQAQLAMRVSADSDYRRRGYSVTDGQPAVTGALSYDDPSGIYANGLIVVAPDDAAPGLSGFEAGLGYATRISRTVSVEGGAIHTRYARSPGGPLDLRYTEIYAGVSVNGISARVYYSPDYLARDLPTLYTELQAGIRLQRDWHLGLHLGALTYLDDLPRYTVRSRYDWRATVSRNLGQFEIYAGLSGRGPGGRYYERHKARAVATVGAAFSF